MINNIIYIKLKNNCSATTYFKKSYIEQSDEYFYNLNEKQADGLNIDKSFLKNKYYVIALIHNNDEIDHAYLGTGEIKHNSKGYSIKLNMKANLKYGTAIQNICKLSDLDFEKDFKKDEYVLIEESELVSNQIDFIINEPFLENACFCEYSKLDSEKELSEYAQRNENCKRQYNLRKPMKNRGEFQRDYERIVHSKAFRRMVDKAQVFSASKGDYYRTRMTHTQAVSQIARGIAEGLKLNLYLTEAIALGHDIGHTPFGHQGERTLNAILHGKYDIIKSVKLIEKANYFGGFKHNYQSLRVASLLEEEYMGICGMDLSFQTLEGMIKHTKLKRNEFILEEFTNDKSANENLHFEQEFCSTLEGQVVAIADEIAQRGHDLDDALSSGAMKFEDLKKYLTIKKMNKLLDIVNGVNKDIEKMINSHRRFIDEKELRNSRIVSAIVSYFINDVIGYSAEKISEYSYSEFENNDFRVSKELICFSETAATLNKYLETIITSKVINSPEVSLFDNNAHTIVKGLFKAYYNNPRLLHKGTQRKLYINLRNVSQNVVDFEYGNHEIIKKEFDLITGYDFDDDVTSELAKEYYDKRCVLVRVICDFISGMTDTYATDEYNRIVK